MSYITTKVQALKSYPTYQFYAAADSKTINIDDVFKICILEALRWIRSRLQDFHDLPKELDAPGPEQYSSFSDDNLTSFSYNNGFQIDVIYIDNIGVWSFRITEPDMGANPGTLQERPAVNGRTFTTEIAFHKQEDCVEIGVRTICSEPSDNTAGCEVFRPRVVKALAENNKLRLLHSGWLLDGSPLEIKNKTDLERFLSVFSAPVRSLPLILVADSGTESQEPQSVFVPPTSHAIPLNNYSIPDFILQDKELKVTISSDITGQKRGFAIREEAENKKKKKPISDNLKFTSTMTKKPVLNYSELANRLIGFAVVVFINEKFFTQIDNKAHIHIKHGDIIIIPHQEPVECYEYDRYCDDMQSFIYTLQAYVVGMQNRAAYKFGNVLFYSDAKLTEFRSKRYQTDSLEEKCSIYELENAELKARLKENAQQQTDMQHTAEALRKEQKKNETLTRELESSADNYQKLLEETEKKESAYRKSAELIQFYKQQIDIAARFPTDKNAVCDWIENNYASEIVVSSRARNELKKYSGSLDFSCLCDGIVFLSAYAKYRRQELSEDLLALYAERRHWDI